MPCLALPSRVCEWNGMTFNQCFFFYRLKPFTSYQFRVKATNDIGDSEYSEESEAITTLQDGRII